jgi:hypothetical protein
MGFVEQRSRTMNQPGKGKLGIAADALAVETGKQRGGRSSVKTFVVIENPNSQSVPLTQDSRRGRYPWRLPRLG